MPFIYLTIILLPVYVIKFSFFGLRTNVLDLLILAAFIFWLIKRLIVEKANIKDLAKNLLIAIRSYLFPIGLILTGLAVSATQSNDIFISLGIIKSWFVLPIVFFVMVVDLAQTEKQWVDVLKAWLFGGALVALVSLVYYFKGAITYDGRLEGFFTSPNYLAMFLAPAFIVGVWAIIQSASWRTKIKIQSTLADKALLKIIYTVYIVSSVLIGVIIFLTQSLGAIMAITISLLPIFYKKIKNDKKSIIFVLGLLFFLLSTFYFLLSVKDFSERSSLASRFMIWQSAVEIMKDNPVLGIGPGMFQEKYLEYQYKFEPYLEWAVPQPHNIFLAFWLQAGVVGFVGFLWVIVVFFKSVWENRKNNLIFLSGILMIYFLTHGLIDNIYFKNDLAVMFWLIIAFSLSKIKNAD